MKTTFILMFSFFLIPGSLSGQNENRNYIDSDIKRQFIIEPSSNRSRRNIMRDTIKQDSLFKRNLERFNLYKDSSLSDSIRLKHFRKILAEEEFPGASRYYGDPFNIKPDSRGKLRILKPDTKSKYYLIIKDPVRHTVTR